MSSASPRSGMSEPTQSGDDRLAPERTPLFEALQSERYARQQLIREYQDAYDCRLVVLVDEIRPTSVTLFEETLVGVDPESDLHVMLDTPGGHGETAIRLVRQAQARCNELTVIVPDRAKSAGTLFALGAHRILMGPTSDLGPVDPQIRLADGSFSAAKAIIDAVKYAEHAVQDHPETYPLHASLLGNLTAVQVQLARNELDHSGAQLRAALRACPGRSSDDIETLAEKLEDRLVNEPQSHGAIVSAQDADELGLPVTELPPSDPQWQSIWRLWAKYFILRPQRVYEGERASQVFDLPE